MHTFHKVFYAILRPLVSAFLWLKFGYRYKREKNLPDNYIVLANHATNFDPLFVAAAFPQMYFVGSEHISRWGFASKLLKFFLAPILRPKGSVASATVKEILHTLREGKNVCLFAEGSCSWDGTPNPILPSTGKMVQKARCGLVTYRLIGGYFAQPRWGTSGTRKGCVRGEPVNVYTKGELAAMTAEEINAAIVRDLWEDAYARQLAHPRRYRSKRTAEGLEYLLFTCPHCGKIDTLRSHGDTVECEQCGLKFQYDQYGMLHGLPFSTLKEFHAWQQEQAAQRAAAGLPYTSQEGRLITVANSTAVPVAAGPVTLSPQALSCGDTVIPLTHISTLDIHSKNALVFTAGKTYYELVPSGSALKFMLLYNALTGKALVNA